MCNNHEAHCHTHTHDHCHEHSSTEKDILFLEYMLDHNQHHEKELREVVHKFEHGGRTEVTQLLNKSIELLAEANGMLAQAIERWKGGA